MSEPIIEGDVPHPHDFAEQLIRQVLADLDGVLLDGEQPAADSFALLAEAAAAGRTRGGALVLLAHAALSAHHALVYGRGEEFAPVGQDEVGALLRRLCAVPAAQLAPLYKAASALEHYLAAAEPGAQRPQQTLALAIHRLYAGMRDGDDALGGRGLVELRSLVVYLDATAQMLDQGSVSAEPLRVMRPDRFHDYFLRFTSVAQAQNGEGAERAVAALSRDGRIEALITEDAPHPVIAAAQQVHEAVAGDERTKDHVLARIRALLAFLTLLRARPRPQLGDPVAQPDLQIALVIAAATAPLRLGAEFEFAALTQIARYNLGLLRGRPGLGQRAH
jgi:hypothetical protein